jgi:hypothetical protein
VATTLSAPTIEGDGVQEELKKLKVIEAIPNVISADMQMAYSQEELDSHLEVLESKGLQLSKLSDIQNEIVFDFISLIEDSEE